MPSHRWAASGGPVLARRVIMQGTVLTTSRSVKRKKSLSRIALAAAVIVAGAGGYYWYQHSGPAKRVAAPRTIPVSVAAAVRQDVPIYVSGLGTVQALNTVPVHSQVDGQLVDIAFTEGQHVKKGDVLAKIDPRLFQAALDQALAKKGQDEANLISADKDLTRAKTLVVRNFETQQVVDQQQAKVDALKASIKADEAAIESTRTQLDYTTITSPIEGRAGIRQIDIGRIIHANDSTPLVVLTQTQPSTVVFTLPQVLLEPVREAMDRGPVEVTALDQNNVKTLGTGKLLLIDVVIDQASGRAAMAGGIRQCKSEARHRKQRPDDPLDCPPARSQRVVYLGDWHGPKSRDAAHQDGPADRRAHHRDRWA